MTSPAEPSLHQVGDIVDRRCPRCGNIVPHQLGYVPWCECGWNIEDPPAPTTLFGRVWKRFNDRSGRSLLDEVKRHGTTPPQLTLPRILSVALSIVIIGATVALPLWLFWIAFIIWPAWGVVFPLTIAFAFIYWFRPRFTRDRPDIADSAHFPTLYRVVNEVATAMGTRPVDGIVFIPGDNAAVGESGWRRRRILYWGLSHYALRTPGEWVAVLGHEFGHFVNGDPLRGRTVHGALQTLYRWLEIIQPNDVDDFVECYSGGRGIIVMDMRRLVAAAFSSVITLFGILIWRDSQRAEYRADMLAVGVAGRAATLSAKEKAGWISVVNYAISRAKAGMGSGNVFLDIQEEATRVPLREQERVRRNLARPEPALNDSHPPDAFRLEAVQSLADRPPQYVLAEADIAALNAELLPVFQHFHAGMLEQDRFRPGQAEFEYRHD